MFHMYSELLPHALKHQQWRWYLYNLASLQCICAGLKTVWVLQGNMKWWQREEFMFLPEIKSQSPSCSTVILLTQTFWSVVWMRTTRFQFNCLKPSSYCFYVPPGLTSKNSRWCTHCVYVLCTDLRTNSNFHLIQH